MNFYRIAFSAQCPTNGALITYQLEIRTRRLILVEEILETLKGATDVPVYHEDLADKIYEEIGGIQHVLKAHHHGVDIETHRP